MEPLGATSPSISTRSHQYCARPPIEVSTSAWCCGFTRARTCRGCALVKFGKAAFGEGLMTRSDRALVALVPFLGALAGQPVRAQRREWMLGPFEKPEDGNPVITPRRASTFR